MQSLPHTAGAALLTHIKSGKQWAFESGADLHNHVLRQFSLLKSGKHPDKVLQRLFATSGKAGFSVAHAVLDVSHSMEQALSLVTQHGYKPEELRSLRGDAWRVLVDAAPTKKIRDCIQAHRWTHGDLDLLYRHRAEQKAARQAN